MQYDHGFKQGDLVRARAGGPIMSVELMVGDLLLCAWTETTGRSRRRTFASQELQAAEAAPAVWVDVLQRLTARWTVVAATH